MCTRLRRLCRVSVYIRVRGTHNHVERAHTPITYRRIRRTHVAREIIPMSVRFMHAVVCAVRASNSCTYTLLRRKFPLPLCQCPARRHLRRVSSVTEQRYARPFAFARETIPIPTTVNSSNYRHLEKIRYKRMMSLSWIKSNSSSVLATIFAISAICKERIYRYDILVNGENV